MKLPQFIIIIFFICWAFDVRAQMSAQIPVSERWQLTLDMIKAKVQTLVIENNGLQVEYRKLTEQVQELQESMGAQQYRNEQMARFLKERHGRTDQQVRIEELTRTIKIKNQEARHFDRQWGKLNQLAQLRKQLEDESTQEVLLENELGALKTGDKTKKTGN